MDLKSFFEKINKFTFIFQLIKKILFNPDLITNKTFSHTKNKKLKNKYMYLFFSSLVFIIFVFNFFSDLHGARHLVYVLINLFIVIIVNIPTILSISFLDKKINKEYKLIYFISILSVSLLITLSQVFFLFFYLTFENYLFYYISIIIGFFRIFWLCFYIPVKRNEKEVKSIKCIRIFKTIFTFIITNVFINCLLIIGINNKSHLSEIAFINDPILTETYNEIEFVLQESQQINLTLKEICDISLEDLYKKNELRKTIIQKINIFLIENNRVINNRYEKIKYNKTKKLYNGLILNLENLTTIKQYCEQILDFDFDEKQKLVEQKQKEIEKYNQLINEKKYDFNKAFVLFDIFDQRFDTLIKKLEEIEQRTPITKISNQLQKDQIYSEDNKPNNTFVLLINHCDIMISTIDDLLNTTYPELDKNTYSELINLLNDLKTCFNEQKQELKTLYELNLFIEDTNKKINNLKIDINQLKNDILIVSKIIDLINDTVIISNEQSDYIQKTFKFVDFRFKTFYL